MGKSYLKLLLVVLAIGFCIFFGVDLATRGVERIQGPMGQTAAYLSAGMQAQPGNKPSDTKSAGAGHTGSGAKAPTKSAAEAKAKQQEPVEPKAEISEASGIVLVGNKVGELLQIVAHHGIRLVIALFDAITG